ncbi:PREDICTED: ubiquinol-cytochrome c reductase complex 6.7 kDa protein [Nelumbo nucifera]|uniref:Ubiquinol-cytochrome c reductase complex 6.7 kDa protein n=2 Tax=Nelumbo nucifera TaxID=4432 RepID=A0A822Y2I5_NELNU|nr:PREDICTED: ubiquinol-cytochrome c reductase complex 6.7 kDa protein [Nelumbo nucifera]DAD25761.1 TPA_asm: hypothetical protein HUJ06_027229 [Nelumbo nucifera]
MHCSKSQGFCDTYNKKTEPSFDRGSEMTVGSAAGSGLFKFLRPGLRPQSTDIQAAAMWGVAVTTGALWLIQPFDWLKKTFLEKPESEGP